MKLCLSTDETVRAVALRCRWQDYACWTLRCQWLLSGVSPVCRLCISQQHFVVVMKLRLNELRFVCENCFDTVGWMTRGTATCFNNPKGSISVDPSQPQVNPEKSSWEKTGLVQNTKCGAGKRWLTKCRGNLTLTGKSGVSLNPALHFVSLSKTEYAYLCVCEDNLYKYYYQ